jgi:transketolase
LKPIDIETLKMIAERYTKIITLEEHQQSAGFSSAIVEQINDLYANARLTKYPVIIRKAIKDRFYSVSGSQQYLRNIAGVVLNIEDFE